MVVTASGRHLDRGAGRAVCADCALRPAWVFGASGAAALYRREALDDVAYPAGEVFDEAFFAYREDADLAWRLQRRGWRCLYWPAARAWHARGLKPEHAAPGHAPRSTATRCATASCCAGRTPTGGGGSPASRGGSLRDLVGGGGLPHGRALLAAGPRGGVGAAPAASGRAGAANAVAGARLGLGAGALVPARGPRATGVGVMRVALLGTRGIPARYGGFETFAEELSARLAARGHAVTVYTRSHTGGPGRDACIAARAIRRAAGAARQGARDALAHAALVPRRRRARAFDVVLLCNAANAPLLPLLHARGLPVALNVDGLERKRRKWGADRAHLLPALRAAVGALGRRGRHRRQR